MTYLRRTLLAVLASAVVSLPVQSALAQAKYPARAIKLIIPFPAGGLFDTVGRPLADKLKDHLGAIVVENVGGAGSRRGAAIAAAAEPNGYTLFLAGNGSHLVAPLAATKLKYDPLKDFEPIALLGTTGMAIAVHPDQPFKMLPELIDFIQNNPGKLSFGSAGTGSMTHLTGELFKLRASAPGIVHVPYTGGAPQVNDLLGGHIPMGVITMTAQFFDLHRTGKLRLLAVTTPSRAKELPGVPAAVETVPGMIALNFAGLYAPKGTAKEIIAQISAAVSKVMADPELQKRYRAGGFEPELRNTPEVMRDYLDKELKTWAPVIKASGFRIK
ncbi:MAG: Bug family tripartite tricarboxylate transporter substrate binding protein [Thermomicrobiales bacterium]